MDEGSLVQTGINKGAKKDSTKTKPDEHKAEDTTPKKRKPLEKLACSSMTVGVEHPLGSRLEAIGAHLARGYTR